MGDQAGQLPREVEGVALEIAQQGRVLAEQGDDGLEHLGGGGPLLGSRREQLDDGRQLLAEEALEEFAAGKWGTKYPHAVATWRSSEWDLYCVNTAMRMYPALTRLDRTKSMRR